MGRRASLSTLIGAVAGSLAGLTGVGGGVFLVPLLVTTMGLEQHRAHATSLAIVFFIALAGAITYFALGHTDWTLIALLAAGSMVGVLIGTRLMVRVPARQLRWAFAAFIICLGLYMIFSSA